MSFGKGTVTIHIADTFVTCCVVVYLLLVLIMCYMGFFNQLECSRVQHWAELISSYVAFSVRDHSSISYKSDKCIPLTSLKKLINKCVSICLVTVWKIKVLIFRQKRICFSGMDPNTKSGPEFEFPTIQKLSDQSSGLDHHKTQSKADILGPHSHSVSFLLSPSVSQMGVRISPALLLLFAKLNLAKLVHK